MHRFFLDPDQFNDGTVLFPEGISRQIRKVLRLDIKKDAVIVLDNSGWEYFVQLDGSKGNQLQGHIIDQEEGRSEPLVSLTLCYSQTRREKIEWILQKGTELGVSKFVPFVSSRSLVQNLHQNSARQERLEAIIREACEQSQRSKLPLLYAVHDFEAMLQATQDCSLRLIAWEGTALVKMVDIEMVRKLSDHEQKSIALLIGPEGGFSNEEVDLAEKYGYQQISLGNRILRMETACIAGSAIIRNLSDSLFE